MSFKMGFDSTNYPQETKKSQGSMAEFSKDLKYTTGA